MASPHHAVGQPFSIHIGVYYSAADLQPSVELLQIVLRQLVQRNFPDFGNDMIVNAIFIVGSCGNAECVSAVGLIPEVDPIPERHVGFYIDGSCNTVLFFQPF